MGQYQKNHHATPISLLQLWAIQPSPENLGKIDKANLLWELVEFGGPKFQRAQKKELGPKKKIQWEEGNMSRLKFAQKNLQPRPSAGLVNHRFYRIPLFSLNVLVDLGQLLSYVKVNIKKVWDGENVKTAHFENL